MLLSSKFLFPKIAISRNKVWLLKLMEYCVCQLKKYSNTTFVSIYFLPKKEKQFCRNLTLHQDCVTRDNPPLKYPTIRRSFAADYCSSSARFHSSSNQSTERRSPARRPTLPSAPTSATSLLWRRQVEPAGSWDSAATNLLSGSRMRRRAPPQPPPRWRRIPATGAPASLGPWSPTPISPICGGGCPYTSSAPPPRRCCRRRSLLMSCSFLIKTLIVRSLNSDEQVSGFYIIYRLKNCKVKWSFNIFYMRVWFWGGKSRFSKVKVKGLHLYKLIVEPTCGGIF